jgi:hypothetical protein
MSSRLRLDGRIKVILATLLAMCVVAIILLRPRIARAEILKEGDLAPPITTQMVVGDQISPFTLTDYRGKKVILYFYPKDDTPDAPGRRARSAMASRGS